MAYNYYCFYSVKRYTYNIKLYTKVEKNVYNDKNNECIGCAMCARRCPDMAIEVFR